MKLHCIIIVIPSVSSNFLESLSTKDSKTLTLERKLEKNYKRKMEGWGSEGMD